MQIFLLFSVLHSPICFLHSFSFFAFSFWSSDQVISNGLFSMSPILIYAWSTYTFEFLKNSTVQLLYVFKLKICFWWFLLYCWTNFVHAVFPISFSCLCSCSYLKFFKRILNSSCQSYIFISLGSVIKPLLFIFTWFFMMLHSIL